MMRGRRFWRAPPGNPRNVVQGRMGGSQKLIIIRYFRGAEAATSSGPAAYHIRMSPLILPITSFLPSDEKAREVMMDRSPPPSALNVASSWPVWTSHNFTDESYPPVAKREPSGENTIELTA